MTTPEVSKPLVGVRARTEQPLTLDPNVEIPKNAPRAMGHDEELAAAVKDAADEHKQMVAAEEGQPEVGPRDPGDHAPEPEPKSKAKKE